MRIAFLFALLLLPLLVPSPIAFADSCESFRDPLSRSSIDFAPLKGFVDVLSRDARLVELLTGGYPASVQTAGYFVPAESWQQYENRQIRGFDRYLIAQKCRKTFSVDEFADFKRYVHSKQGDLPDHTQLPLMMKLHGQVSLGIIDETGDSISTGTVITISAPAIAGDKLLAAINIMLQLNGETLSLYVYDSINDLDNTDRIKDLARRWLQCIRAQNQK